MSYLMDYGDDWPPRPPRRRWSLWRWLNAAKGRRRPGFDRWTAINAAAILGVLLIVGAVLKLNDHEQVLRFDSDHHPAPHVASTPRSAHPGNP